MCQFPSDPAVRAKWAQFVGRHRHDFKDPTPKNAHFEESSYQRRQQSLSILSSLEGQGIKMKSCLKKDAIPTRDTVRSNYRMPVAISLQQRNSRERTKFSSEYCSHWHLKVQRRQKMKSERTTKKNRKECRNIFIFERLKEKGTYIKACDIKKVLCDV